MFFFWSWIYLNLNSILYICRDWRAGGEGMTTSPRCRLITPVRWEEIWRHFRYGTEEKGKKKKKELFLCQENLLNFRSNAKITFPKFWIRKDVKAMHWITWFKFKWWPEYSEASLMTLSLVLVVLFSWLLLQLVQSLGFSSVLQRMFNFWYMSLQKEKRKSQYCGVPYWASNVPGRPGRWAAAPVPA